MAKKKIGLYDNLESTANHKVEDLFIIVDYHSIHFVVKHLPTNYIVAFESFVNGSDLNGFAQLLAYLQNNSKLMHLVYNNVHFVMNSTKVLISKKQTNKDLAFYQNEINLVFGNQTDHELLVTPLNDENVIVSSIPDIYQTLLSRSFPTGKWTHYLSAFIQKANEDGVYLYFFESFYIVLIRKDKEILFVRYFEETEAAQNIYNILNACKHCQFDPNQSSLFLKGYNDDNNWVVEIGAYFKVANIEQTPLHGIVKSLQQENHQHHFDTYFIF